MQLEPVRGCLAGALHRKVLKLTGKEPGFGIKPDPWARSAFQGPEKGSGASVWAQILPEESPWVTWVGPCTG